MKRSLTAVLLLPWIVSPIAAADVDEVFQRLIQVTGQFFMLVCSSFLAFQATKAWFNFTNNIINTFQVPLCIR